MKIKTLVMIEKPQKENNLYHTSDLALAVVISLSYPLEKLEKIDARKVLFIFKKNEGLDNLINNYWKGKLCIEPQTYFAQLKNLKNRIYAEK